MFELNGINVLVILKMKFLPLIFGMLQVPSGSGSGIGSGRFPGAYVHPYPQTKALIPICNVPFSQAKFFIFN